MTDSLHQAATYSSIIEELLPLAVYTAMAVVLVGGLLFMAWWLGEKRRGKSDRSHVVL